LKNNEDKDKYKNEYTVNEKNSQEKNIARTISRAKFDVDARLGFLPEYILKRPLVLSSLSSPNHENK
jgi:hypothetical protein